MTGLTSSATPGISLSHWKPGTMAPSIAAPTSGPSKVPTPPSMTERNACTRKRKPRSAESENSGTISAPASPASAAPSAKVRE